MPRRVKCKYCNGTGKTVCTLCKGKGKRLNKLTGEYERCTWCSQTPDRLSREDPKRFDYIGELGMVRCVVCMGQGYYYEED